MRCVNCIWFDKENNDCLVRGIRIFILNLPRRCPFYNVVPEVVKNYLHSIANITNLDVETIKDSDTFKNYLNKLKPVKLKSIKL